MADSPITYEGDDVSTHEASFLKDYALPGDRLRVDPATNVNLDLGSRETLKGGDLAEKLGTDPLTVSKTVITGEGAMIRPEYEFEGVKGRFPARSFQHELGEDGMHGVIAMRDGEMWAVAMNEDSGTMTAAKGPAREVVGFAGKKTDDIHPDGLAGLRKELEDGPFQVDLYHRNAVSFDDKAGPVNIVAMPMTYGRPSDAEMAVADRAIDAAAFEKRIGEVVRDSEKLLKDGGLERADSSERTEVTDLVGALDARRREPSMQNSGNVLDAANATLGALDDAGLSARPGWDKLAYSVEAAERAGDTLLKGRHADLGLTAAAARDMEAVAKQHDDAVDARAETKGGKPTAAVAGAAMAAMSQRGV